MASMESGGDGPGRAAMVRPADLGGDGELRLWGGRRTFASMGSGGDVKG